MNNDLKFPLTAAVGFLLGGLLFYPWNMNNDAVTLSSIKKKPAELKVANLNKLVVNKIEYRFDALELSSSNLAIKNQLKNNNVVEHKVNELGISVNEDAIAMESYLSGVKQNSNINQKVEVQKTVYRFPARLLESSNLAIEKQLAHYEEVSATDVTDNNQQINIEQLEVAENSETEKLVNNAADFSNSDSDKTAVKITKVRAKLEIKQKTPTFFSKSQVKISNLAINKQLRGYRAVIEKNTSDTPVNDTALSNIEIESELPPVPDNVDIENPVVENNTQAKHEIESELLLSNTEVKDEDEDSDDEDFSRVFVYKNPNYGESEFESNHSLHGEQDDDDEEDFSQVLAYSNPNYANTENELDEDDDEYGSERIMFNHEPYYFTENFENNLNNSLIGKNIDVPNVEDIHEKSKSDVTAENEESEIIIEEIDFNDDGNVMTSASN